MADFGSVAVYYGDSRDYRFKPVNLSQDSNVVYYACDPRKELSGLPVNNGNVSYYECDPRKSLSSLFACSIDGRLPWGEAGANFSQDYSIWFAGALEGTVLDSLGSPISGYLLGLYHRLSMHIIARTATDPWGHYSFSNLKAATDFFIVALDPTQNADAMAHDKLTPGS